MKNTFIKIAILCTLLIANHAYGQACVQPAQYQTGENAFRKFLLTKFHEEAKKRNLDICMTGIVFVKFTIDSTGNIRNLAFSKLKNTPYIFKELLTAVIKATNGAWNPCKINGKPIESKPFILPLIYDMEAGCIPKEPVASGVKTNYQPIKNSTEADLIYILDFDDNAGNDLVQLDCIMLRPLRVFSQN